MAIRFAQPATKPIARQTKAAKHAGGRPKSGNPKVVLNIRVDADIVARRQATGAGWQSRINEWLKQAKL
jgi:uncharacterized protein (DUF4415 family)